MGDRYRRAHVSGGSGDATGGGGEAVRNVDGIDSAKVKVAALKADNTPGRAAKAKLKAKPKKRRKGKR